MIFILHTFLNKILLCLDMAFPYNFSEWNMLVPDIRADIIPVIENIRSGAKIELWRKKYGPSQKKYLKDWLISSRLKSRDHKLNYYICKSESWIDKFWKGEIKEGEFLGHPLCCIKKFEEGCKRFLADEGLGPLTEFRRDIKQAIENNSFDQALYYALYIPCRLDCGKTLKMARKVKQVLELKDPEAAEYLKRFNGK